MFRVGQRLANSIVKQHSGSPRFAIPIRLYDIIHHHRVSTLKLRLYSTDRRDDGKSGRSQTPCETTMRSGRPQKGGECKPKARRTPCAPMSPDCQKIPSIDDCKKENILDDCPKPDCPWEEGDGPARRHYKKLLWLGLLLGAAALGTMIFMTYKPPPKKKRKKKVKTKSRKKGVIEKIPPNSGPIPKEIPYLVIGGGTSAFAAFRSIKSIDPTAKILIIASEPQFPYMRPPLSKEMWLTENQEMLQNMEFKQWNGKVRSLFYEPDDFYTEMHLLKSSANGGVSVASGWKINRIDVVERTAYLSDGAAIKYGKCLIATGARPKTMDVLDNIDESVADRISTFRGIDDFNCLRENLKDAKSIAVIGGGFLGTELSCAIARFGKTSKLEVIQIFKESGVLAKILPEYLSQWTSGRVLEEGVEIMSDTIVTEAIADGEQIQLTLCNNSKVTVDEVLICIGMEPNTQIADDSLLEVDPVLGGFIVNAELQARTDLWVAGDCASFYDTKFGRRRLEHHDNAVVTGRIAGENMTGSSKPYTHQSMYWSDVGQRIGFEAIGTVDSTLPTVGVFVKPPEKAGKSAEDGVELATTQAEGRYVDETIPEECEKYASKQNIEDQRHRLAKAREAKSKEKDNEEFGKGVVFYLRDDIVVGMVLWNVFHRMGIARQILADKRKYEDLNEVAKLFKIHEE